MWVSLSYIRCSSLYDGLCVVIGMPHVRLSDKITGELAAFLCTVGNGGNWEKSVSIARFYGPGAAYKIISASLMCTCQLSKIARTSIFHFNSCAERIIDPALWKILLSPKLDCLPPCFLRITYRWNALWTIHLPFL